MDANLYQLDGKVSRKIQLPEIFTREFRIDLIRRAIHAEQSLRRQPQAHFAMAGMQTTATYVGEYGVYRAGRHMGTAIRPRQKLAGGAMGQVRRVPSSVKGKRAHPHKIEKKIVERMNIQEYRKALESAIASTSMHDLVARKHIIKNESLPIVIEDKIESISRTKELLRVIKDLGISEDLSRSHDPKIKKGLRRSVKRRIFRKSILIVVKDRRNIEKAGRNIPGVEVKSVGDLRVENLAPGAMPRLTIWSEGAIAGVMSATMKAEP
jgi:large subunit ribosomal protein L4e